MKLNIAAHKTTLTPEIKKYTTIKMKKLCKNYKQILEIDVVLEESHKKTSSNIATAKANIRVAGPDISAQSDEKTIFAAVDELERKLIRLLEKNKSAHNPKNTRFVRSKKLINKILRRSEQG